MITSEHLEEAQSTDTHLIMSAEEDATPELCP